VRGLNLAYTWFGLQTGASVLQTHEHKMASLPLIPPSEIESDWLGETHFREMFERLGKGMNNADYLILKQVPEISRAFTVLKEEVNGQGVFRPFLIYTSLMEIFTRLSRRLETGPAAGQNSVLGQLMDFIRAHYNQRLSLGRLSDFSGYTPTYLSRMFARKTGMTISRFIEHVRMSRARELLIAGTPVGETSRLSGFSSTSYFSRRFTALFGTRPREWRQNHVQVRDC
jgi:AraC-like DNA-binding protein